MKNKIIVFGAYVMLSVGAWSCVSKKNVAILQKKYDAEITKLSNDVQLVKQELIDTEKEGMALRAEVKGKNVEIQNLANQQKINVEQLEYLKKTNSNLLERLSDLSLVNKTSSENMRKSLEALNEQSKYTKDLTDYLSKRDSLNLVIAADLKKVIDQKPEMFNLEIKNKVLVFTIKDAIFFEENGWVNSTKNDSIFKSLVQVILKHKTTDLLAVGHSSNTTMADYDNWELTSRKTNNLARKLIASGVLPERITTGNAAEYQPMSFLSTAKAAAANKRTEIWFIGKIDAYFSLNK